MTSDPNDPTPTSRELEAVLDQTLNPDEPEHAAFLLVLSGEHPGRLFPLDRPERLIGRGKQADIRIDQQSISYRHAKILSGNGVHRLVDLGSTNGTFVNDRPVVGQVDLNGGDVIRVGETTMSFLMSREHGDLPTVAIEHVPMARLSQPPPQLPAHAGFQRLPAGSYPEFQVHTVEDGPTLRDLLARLVTVLRFLRRHRTALLVSGLVAAAGGGVSSFVLPPPGTAEFEVKLTPKTAQNPVQQFDGTNLEFFSSAETTFRSPDLLRETLKALGDNPTDETLTRIRDRLKFDATGHLTYRGTYTDRTAERALAVLDRHVRTYLDSEIEKTLKVIHAEVDFLKGQLAQNEAELLRTEGALRDFKSSHVDGLPEQAEGQFTARLALKQRQTELSSEAERASLELASAKARLTREDPVLDQKVQMSQPYQAALVDVKRKLSEARASGLGDEHPEVIRLKKQMEELTHLSDQAMNADVSDISRRTNPAFKAMRERVAELEVQRRAASSELARVNTELSKLDKVVQDLPEVEAKYAELTRTYAATKDLHTKLFERYKAAELQLELERASAAARYEILTAPEVQKVSLRKITATRVGIGAAVGILIALVIAMIGEARKYIRANLPET